MWSPLRSASGSCAATCAAVVLIVSCLPAQVPTSYLEAARLTKSASAGLAFASFGGSVAIDGDTVVVGAPQTNVCVEPSPCIFVTDSATVTISR